MLDQDKTKEQLIAEMAELRKMISAESQINEYRSNLEELLQIRTSELAEANAKLQHEIEQHRLTEKALNESVNNFISLVELSPDGICILHKGIITFINSAGLKIIGAESSSQIIGKSYLDIVHPDYRTVMLERMHNIRTTGKAQPFIEQPFIRLDGSIIDVEVGSTICFYNNQLCGQVVFRDVTQRKAIAETLRVSEERFRAVAESSLDGILISDSDLNIIFVNNSIETILGFNKNELLGNAISILMPASTFHKLKQAKNNFLNSLRSQVSNNVFESIMAKKDGTEFPVEVALSNWESGGRVFFGAMLRDISERKRTENLLRRSEELYRSVVETANDAIITVNKNGIITSWNKTAVSIYGYSTEEIVGRHISIIIPERFRTANLMKAENFVSPDMLSMNKNITDLAGLKKDGSEFPAELSISVWESSNETYVTAIVHDISERKRTESALRESEERFRNLAQSASDAIILVNNSGNIVFWNKAANLIYGYSEEEIMGKPVQILLPERYRENDSIKFNNLTASGSSPFIGNVRDSYGLTKQGTEFPAEVSLSFWTTNRGTYYSAIIRDVTSRRRAEEFLRESEEKFRTMAESIACSIFVFQGTHLVYANPTAERLSGYSLEELQHINFWEIVHPDFREQAKEWGLERLSQGALLPSPYELKIINKNGAENWFYYTVATIQYQGKPAVLGTAIDITERKQAEELIKTVNNCLLSFTPDPDENIQSVVESAGSILNGVCAVYHKINGSYVAIKAKWNIPAAFAKLTSPKARAFRDMFSQSSDQRCIYIPLHERHFTTQEASLLHGRFETSIAVPIKTNNAIMGSLNVSYKSNKTLTRNEETVFTILAKAISIEEERKRFLTALKRQQKKINNSEKQLKYFSQKILSAREEEKKNISKDLHDEIGSMAIALSSGLAIAKEEIVENNPEQAMKYLAQTDRALKTAIDSLKKITIDLRPPNLEIVGLSTALKNYLSTITQQVSITINCSITLTERKIPEDTAIVIYRVCQEAMNNVVKHAHAHTVNLQLDSDVKNINLRITDDGRGFNMKILNESFKGIPKIGILGMRERVESLGGTFSMESFPKKGTSIYASVPYH